MHTMTTYVQYRNELYDRDKKVMQAAIGEVFNDGN